MTAHLKTTARCVLVGALLTGAGACDATGEAPSPADATETIEAKVVDTLPLRSGYYVGSDTPCAQASNATLHLMHDDGEGYGGFTTPPYYCAFVRIEQTGPSRYRVTEACGNTYGEGDEPAAAVSLYDIVSDTHYRARREDGWQSESRRCPRRELPALWRDSGLGDYVD